MRFPFIFLLLTIDRALSVLDRPISSHTHSYRLTSYCVLPISECTQSTSTRIPKLNSDLISLLQADTNLCLNLYKDHVSQRVTKFGNGHIISHSKFTTLHRCVLKYHSPISHLDLCCWLWASDSRVLSHLVYCSETGEHFPARWVCWGESEHGNLTLLQNKSTELRPVRKGGLRRLTIAPWSSWFTVRTHVAHRPIWPVVCLLKCFVSFWDVWHMWTCCPQTEHRCTNHKTAESASTHTHCWSSIWSGYFMITWNPNFQQNYDLSVFAGCVINL